MLYMFIYDWLTPSRARFSKMPKRVAKTQFTQDNADQYLEEEGDKDEVREFTAVFVGSYMYHRVLPSLYLTEWALHESKSRRH